MKLTLALLAVAFAAVAAPAAACDSFICPDSELSDDSFPPGTPSLRPNVRAQVVARDGKGLSLAGFYNDPSLALAREPRRRFGYVRH